MKASNVLSFCSLLILVNSSRRPPNTVIFLADDLGYGDLNLYGNTEQEPGAIEKMAKEGMTFTQWTSSAFVCSPSRASLLTGRYARRTGVYGNSSLVFLPGDTGGLPASEITLAEILKDRGYATGMVGKWHLGTNRFTNTDGLHLPHNHGFDFVGTNLPHSQFDDCFVGNSIEDMINDCFLYNGSSVVEQPINLPDLTQKLVDDSVKFIENNKDKPFFLYVSFPQVHTAYFCDSRFCGRSGRGDYGDNINEMSWAIGKILNKIKYLGLDDDTLAIFTSDHGGLYPLCDTPVSNGIYRGGKFTTWEGGYRVPAIIRWPRKIKPSTISHTLINNVDIFTTLVHLAGGKNYLSQLRSTGTVIDGQLIPELVPGSPPRETLFYYCSDRLMAVRHGDYKLHYRTMGDLTLSPDCASEMGSWSCYDGADIYDWDPPLLFHLTKPGGEREIIREDPRDPNTKEIIESIAKLVTKHEETFTTITPSEIDKPHYEELIPCCDPSNGCVCNYNY